MSARVELVALCFEANDPLRLARFWADALRWEVAGDPETEPDAEPDSGTDAEVGLVPTDGTRFRIRFLPTSEPKAGKNRVHLDLTTASIDDQAETVERLIGLGARPVDVGQGPDEGHVVLADPEGNEFCVIEPDNSFLAGCGRLGSITCDGSPEVGSFWSEALGWPLVWDQDDETAIRAPDGSGPFITWGPPVPPKIAENRLHLDLAPADPVDPVDQPAEAAVDRLVSLGATRVGRGRGDGRSVVLADPDGNDFFVSNTR